MRQLLLVVIALSLVGCAGAQREPLAWKDPAFDLSWPQPPDAERVNYLRSFTGPKDFQKEDQTQKAWRWLFGEDESLLQLLTPFALAYADDLLWVADSGARMLYRIDLARQDVDYFREFSDRLLTLPSGVAVDSPRSRVFLADAALDSILVLDPEGTLITRWSPPGGFQRPGGLAVAPSGELYACDALAGLVYVFDTEGRLVSTLHSQVNEDGRFLRPLSVGLGPAGEVVVLDALAFRVEVLSREGLLLSSFGKVGDSAGRFARPKGLAVDGAGNIFVSDAAFDNIQAFDLAGNLLMYWGQAGSQPGQFSLPAGLFVDTQGRLFVADSYNHRVQVFELTSPPSQ